MAKGVPAVNTPAPTPVTPPAALPVAAQPVVPKGWQLPYWHGLHSLEKGDEEVRILPDIIEVMRAVECGAVNVICPIAPVNALSLAALSTILKEKDLTIAF